MADLISTQQVARLLNVGDRTVILYAAKGILRPAFKLNNRLKFDRQEVERLIASGGELSNKKPKNIEV